MKQIRVTSWNQLNDELYAEAWKEPLGRFRSNFAFRGMGRSTEALTTTLCRLGGQYPRSEGHLLRNFRKFAHRSVSPSLGDSVWNWLALAQHHGLPSRLLDWTFSPFVALHFATQNLERFDEDGIVWCVDYVKAHKLLPRALTRVLRDEQADVFTTEMLERAASTLTEFDRLARSRARGRGRGRSGGGAFAIFIDPPSLDDRIVNQFAMLSMMSSPTVQLDDWLARHPSLYRRIIIPAELKWEIRDRLDQANITERVLFPGLDGLSRWLKRYYSPSTRAAPSRAAKRPRAGDDDHEAEVEEAPSEALTSRRDEGRSNGARAAGAARRPTRT